MAYILNKQFKNKKMTQNKIIHNLYRVSRSVNPTSHQKKFTNENFLGFSKVTSPKGESFQTFKNKKIWSSRGSFPRYNIYSILDNLNFSKKNKAYKPCFTYSNNMFPSDPKGSLDESLLKIFKFSNNKFYKPRRFTNNNLIPRYGSSLSNAGLHTFSFTNFKSKGRIS